MHDLDRSGGKMSRKPVDLLGVFAYTTAAVEPSTVTLSFSFAISLA
jgi:hypothetical protein